MASPRTGNKASGSNGTKGAVASTDTPESTNGRSARERCYEAIMADMKSGIARYYGEHSDRLGDSRSGDAVAWSTRGIRRILRILEQYDIQDAPRGDGETASTVAAEEVQA